MNRQTIILLLIVTSMFAPISNLYSSPVIISENFPPLNYLENGKLKGPAAEVVQQIMQTLGLHKNKIKVYPWARGYETVQRQSNTALFSTVRNQERESLFKWVGPLAVKRAVFFAKKDSDITITKLDDARNVNSIGAQIKYVYERDLLNAGFTNVDSVPADRLNVSKLVNDRISLWYTGYYSGLILAKNEKLEELIKPVFTVKKIYLYIAFNKQTRNDTIHEWQRSLDRMKKEGAVNAIFEKYDMSVLLPSN